MQRTTPLLLATLIVLLLAGPVEAREDLPTGTDVRGECVYLYEFPDAGQAYCVDKDDSDDCLVYSWSQSIMGPRTQCHVYDP